jgi:hypothetical protein
MAEQAGEIRVQRRWRLLAPAAFAALVTALALAAARPPDAAAVVCQKPSITGAAVVGQPLTATAGSCTLPVPVTLEWYRCGGDTEATCTTSVQAPGAGPSSYTPVAADAGRRLAVKQVAGEPPVAETSWSPLTGLVQQPVPQQPAGGGSSGGFAGSSPGGSAPPSGAPGGGTTGPRLLSPFPLVKIAGRLTTRGARITRLSVRAPRGSTVRARCRGRGCRTKPSRVRVGRKRVVRLRRFERHVLAGSALQIAITKPGYVGKFTRFRFRLRRAPLRLDACVKPGSWSPVQCPG